MAIVSSLATLYGVGIGLFGDAIFAFSCATKRIVSGTLRSVLQRYQGRHERLVNLAVRFGYD